MAALFWEVREDISRALFRRSLLAETSFSLCDGRSLWQKMFSRYMGFGLLRLTGLLPQCRKRF